MTNQQKKELVENLYKNQHLLFGEIYQFLRDGEEIPQSYDIIVVMYVNATSIMNAPRPIEYFPAASVYESHEALLSSHYSDIYDALVAYNIIEGDEEDDLI